MKHYGIWNSIQKEFQFGIDEPTIEKARKKLFKKIGYDSYKWRFEVKEINMKGFDNMKNLMEIAGDVMKNFNPETDNVDDFEKLPDGEYACLLEDVSKKQSGSGNDYICIRFTVIDGEYTDRSIWVNYWFTDKTIERSIKLIRKLIFDFGYELPLEAFETLETLAEALNSLAGNQATVKQSTSKSDYTNYKVTPIV